MLIEGLEIVHRCNLENLRVSGHAKEMLLLEVADFFWLYLLLVVPSVVEQVFCCRVPSLLHVSRRDHIHVDALNVGLSRYLVRMDRHELLLDLPLVYFTEKVSEVALCQAVLARSSRYLWWSSLLRRVSSYDMLYIFLINLRLRCGV